jgi:hypothetical protein
MHPHVCPFDYAQDRLSPVEGEDVNNRLRVERFDLVIPPAITVTAKKVLEEM